MKDTHRPKGGDSALAGLEGGAVATREQPQQDEWFWRIVHATQRIVPNAWSWLPPLSHPLCRFCVGASGRGFSTLVALPYSKLIHGCKKARVSSHALRSSNGVPLGGAVNPRVLIGAPSSSLMKSGLGGCRTPLVDSPPDGSAKSDSYPGKPNFLWFDINETYYTIHPY